MKRRWVVGGGFVVVVGLVGGAAWFGPRVLAGRLRPLIAAELERRVDADVRFASMTVDPWSAFPRVDAVLTDLHVVNRAPFAGTELLVAEEIRVGVDVLSLLGGPIGVRAVAVRAPRVVVTSDGEGHSNLDVWRADGAADAAGGAWAVDLDRVEVADLHLSLTDASGLRIVADDVDHHLAGQASSTGTRLSTTTTAGAVTYTQLGVDWLREARVVAVADVDVVGDTVTLTKGELGVNALRLAGNGKATVGADGVDVDGQFAAADTAFATLLSLIPGGYGPAFAGLQASGSLSLTGTVAGRYLTDGSSYPGFDAKIGVVDGAFRYPGVPVGVDGVGLVVAVTHPQGPLDGVVLDVADARLAVDGRPVSGRLRVAHPLSDPELDAGAEGDLDLARLAAAFPDGTGAKGRVAGKVAVAGLWSDLVAGDVAAVRASGDVRATDLELAWSALAAPVVLEVLDASVSNNRADLRACVARTGPSDASITGQVDHPLAWVLGAGALGGRVDVVSRRVDLDHLWADDGAAAGVAVVPTDLELTIGIRADEVISSGIMAKNVVGTVHLADGIASFEGLSLDLVGGRVGLSGTYAAPTADGAALDVDVSATSLDVHESAAMFPFLAKVAPVLAAATGRFDAVARLRGKLGADGSLDLTSAASEGRIDSHGVAVKPASLTRVATAVGDPSLDGVTVDGGRLRFKMKAGKVSIDPTPLTLGRTPAALSGVIDVPASGLALALGFAASTRGLGDLAVGAVGERTNVVVRLVGPWDDPKVKVELPGLEDALAAAKDQVVAALSDEMAKADEAGDRLLAEAERTRDALVAAANAEAEKLRAAARREGAKLEAEANNPIAAAAAKAARKQLEATADAAAKKLVGEADAKGTAVIEAARQKKDALVRAAQK